MLTLGGGCLSTRIRREYEKEEMTTVCVAGKFDPLHGGHIEHFILAKELGDELVVITHSDVVLEKVKGKSNFPLSQRIRWLNQIKCIDTIIISIDTDGTSAETLGWLKPDIFAKGGDRTLGNMPQNELDVCKEMGIEIVYGVSGKLASSTELANGWKSK